MNTLFDPPPIPDDATWEGRARAFHAAHPEVYAEIVRLARAVQARGFAQYSIKGLFEVARFNISERRAAAEPFKLNNNYTPFYARLIMAQEPDLSGFFATREAGH